MNTKLENEPQEPQNGEVLHQRSEKARESGNFVDALSFGRQAISQYGVEGNKIKEAEAYASCSLTYRHMFEKTGDVHNLEDAKNDAQKGVEIMVQIGSKEGLVRPLYTLGKVHEMLEDWPSARRSIKEAASIISEFGIQDEVEGERAEMNTRLATIEYRLGDKDAEKRFQEAVVDLGEIPESYERFVWLSGAHMHMARVYAEKGIDKHKAMDQLEAARKILDSADADKYNLTLRWEQLKKLQNEIGYGLE